MPGVPSALYLRLLVRKTVTVIGKVRIYELLLLTGGLTFRLGAQLQRNPRDLGFAVCNPHGTCAIHVFKQLKVCFC